MSFADHPAALAARVAGGGLSGRAGVVYQSGPSPHGAAARAFQLQGSGRGDVVRGPGADRPSARDRIRTAAPGARGQDDARPKPRRQRSREQSGLNDRSQAARNTRSTRSDGRG